MISGDTQDIFYPLERVKVWGVLSLYNVLPQEYYSTQNPGLVLYVICLGVLYS
jgi:hypothetical protein